MYVSMLTTMWAKDSIYEILPHLLQIKYPFHDDKPFCQPCCTVFDFVCKHLPPRQTSVSIHFHMRSKLVADFKNLLKLCNMSLSKSAQTPIMALYCYKVMQDKFTLIATSGTCYVMMVQLWQNQTLDYSLQTLHRCKVYVVFKELKCAQTLNVQTLI